MLTILLTIIMPAEHAMKKVHDATVAKSWLGTAIEPSLCLLSPLSPFPTLSLTHPTRARAQPPASRPALT